LSGGKGKKRGERSCPKVRIAWVLGPCLLPWGKKKKGGRAQGQITLGEKGEKKTPDK